MQEAHENGWKCEFCGYTRPKDKDQKAYTLPSCFPQPAKKLTGQNNTGTETGTEASVWSSPELNSSIA